MKVDKAYIEQVRSMGNIEIPEELEQMLIERLGQEDEQYEYTEQDLYEQARKIIQRYHTPEGRLELRYHVDQLEMQLEFERNRIWRELLDLGEIDETF
jgi:hypothetical protein